MTKFLIFDITRIRVGTYLSWLILVASMPWLVFAVDTIVRLQDTQRRQQEVVLMEWASDATKPLERAVEQLESGLLTLTGSDTLRRGDLEGFKREMRPLSDRLDHVFITLTAADTSSVLRVGETHQGSPADDAALRQAALAAIRAGGPVVTNLLAVDDPKHHAVAVAVPAVRSGETAPAFILVGALDPSRLARLAWLPPSHPEGMVITILDREGVTVARSLHSDLHIGDPAGPGFLASVADRASGLLPSGDTIGGFPAIRAFSKAQRSGYTVVAAVPQSAFEETIRRQLTVLIATAAAYLTLGVLAAGCLAGRLVGRLRAVEQDGVGAPSSGLRELDELAARVHAVLAERDVSQALLRDLVETLNLTPVAVRGMDGSIRFWSQGCVRLYGWTPEEVAGQSADELLRTQFPVPFADIEQALLTKCEWKGDLVQRRRDGSSIVVAAHRTLKRGIVEGGDVVIECLVDVTLLRDAQDALRAIDQGLEQRVKAEIAARKAAQQRTAHADQIQALGQLAGGIAHDFNNVLQAVAGGAALIAHRPNDAEGVGHLVQVIRDAAARGASITQRMLVLARQSDLKTEPVDAATLLDEMREVIIQSLGAAIDVEVQTASGLPRLLADKAQLKTAIVNLATNARDAMPDGGVLRLLSGFELVAEPHPAGLPSGAYVRISVVDDGTGMSEATMARIGEPFFTTKGVGKGTGLGLSMVQGFVDQSAGGLVIESAIGVGTRVTLWLPGVPADVSEWLAAEEGRSRCMGRILLVDDDKLVRDSLREQLEELGHKVQAASGGSDALAILRARQAVDLMITDLSMPGMSGLALIKEAHGLHPSLPAILLTGHTGDPAVLENDAAAKGTYTLMHKPASKAILSARVRTLLEQA